MQCDPGLTYGVQSARSTNQDAKKGPGLDGPSCSLARASRDVCLPRLPWNTARYGSVPHAAGSVFAKTKGSGGNAMPDAAASHLCVQLWAATHVVVLSWLGLPGRARG